MKISEYKMKSYNNEIMLNIQLEVMQGALITPSVYLYIKNKKTAKEKLPNSVDKDYFFSIGLSDELKYGLIVIEFVLDLKFVDMDYWDECFEELKIKYSLSGGLTTEDFKHKETDIKYNSSSGKIIQTEKRFILI